MSALTAVWHAVGAHLALAFLAISLVCLIGLALAARVSSTTDESEKFADVDALAEKRRRIRAQRVESHHEQSGIDESMFT